MIPKELQPFPPGTRLVVDGAEKSWIGYATGGFIKLSAHSELYVQIWWKVRTRPIAEAWSANVCVTSEPLSKCRPWRIRYVLKNKRRRFVIRK